MKVILDKDPPLSNKDFADKCLSSNTDECIIGVFETPRPRVYVSGGRMVGLRDYICRSAHGDPEEAEFPLVPYVTCNDPDCYNPRHIEWMDHRKAGTIGRVGVGKRTLVASYMERVTGLWVYKAGDVSQIVEVDIA